MRNYILYHNASDMGYDLEGNDLFGEEEGVNVFSSSVFNDGEVYEPDWEFFAGDEDLEEYTFSIATSNKKETEESIGQRVWVIQGEAFSSPRRYYLHGYFSPLVTEKKEIKLGGRKFQYQLLEHLT